MAKEQPTDGLKGLSQTRSDLEQFFKELPEAIRRYFNGSLQWLHFFCPWRSSPRRGADWLRRRWSKDRWLALLMHCLCNGRLWSVTVATWLVWLFWGGLFEGLDPFGMGRASGQYSDTVVARIEAPFYRSKAQDKIAVVLIDERTLAQRQMQWPPPYSYYAGLVYTIASAKPRGIFLDFLLEETRVHDQSLVPAISELRDDLEDAGLPLLIAQSLPGKTNVFSALQGDHGVQSALITWVDVGEGYPLSLAGNQTIHHATAQAELEHAQCTALPMYDSAAYRLYQMACSTPAEGCATAPIVRDENLCRRPLKIIWGGLSSEKTKQADQGWSADCDTAALTLVGQIHSALRAAGLALTSGVWPENVEAGRRTCPHILTLKEEQLDDPEVAALLEDRMVLVGAQLDGIQDVVRSPVNGQLPGVYLHAMALDNLMHYGGDYPVSNPWRVRLLQAATGLVVAYLSTLYLLGRPYRYRTGLFLIAASALLASVLLSRWSGFSAGMNWFAMLVLFALVGRYRGQIDKQLENTPPKIPTGAEP